MGSFLYQGLNNRSKFVLTTKHVTKKTAIPIVHGSFPVGMPTDKPRVENVVRFCMRLGLEERPVITLIFES